MEFYLNDLVSFEETIFPFEMSNEVLFAISLDQIHLLELNNHLSFSSLDFQ